MLVDDIVCLYDTPEKINKLPIAAQDVWKSLRPEHQQHMIPRRIQQGIWEGTSNARHDIEEDNLDDFMIRNGNLKHAFGDTRTGLQIIAQEGHVNSYGSCDSIENLLTHPDYAPILNGPRRFTIFMRELEKESDGDWRWHKNGPYIGNQEPAAEHYGDESEVDKVWTFFIIEHRCELLTSESHVAL